MNHPKPDQHQSQATRKVYNIDNHRNIVSLNGGYPAFKTTFTARSGGKFQGVVVDQETLDTSNKLQYRDSSTTVEGEWFNGELEYTDSIPRQFYLVLIAPEPVEVIVETITEPRQIVPKLPPQIPEEPAPEPEQTQTTKQGLGKWATISIILIITVVVAGLIMGVTKKGANISGGLPDLDNILASF